MAGIIILLAAIIIIALIFSGSSQEPHTDHYTSSEVTGFVYVIENELFPEYCKIGMTTRSVAERVKEFNTAVPVNFKIGLEIPCPDPYAIEQQLHELFKEYKVKNKEWFKVDQETFEERMLTLDWVSRKEDGEEN